MTIVRTTLWNGLAVGIRLSTGLILNKILAILVGPSGYAVIGQLQNATQILFTFSAGAINTGVSKYTAEYEGRPERQARLWSTAARIVVIASVLVSALIVLFHRDLARYFLRNEAFSTIFLWLAGSIVLFSLNTMLLSVVTGKKDLRTYVASNIAGSALILVSMAGLTWFFGLYGALVAMSVNQAIVFFATLWLCRNRPWFRRSNFLARFSRPMAWRLAAFTIMTAIAALANHGGQVVVRMVLVEEFGLDVAGYWDGMIRISQLNMMLVATTMSFYFIPRISELHFWDDIRQEIWAGGKLILPLFAAGAVLAYLLRDLLILVLFTSDFAPMEALFGWQLAGDTVRVASWFLAYVMIGKALVRTYALTELLTNILFVALSWWWIRQIGFQGVAVAYFLTYTAAIIGMFVAVSRSRRLPRRTPGGREARPL